MNLETVGDTYGSFSIIKALEISIFPGYGYPNEVRLKYMAS